MTPLLCAICRGHSKVVKLLVEGGASVRWLYFYPFDSHYQKTVNDGQALLLATIMSDSETLKMLLAANVQPDLEQQGVISGRNTCQTWECRGTALFCAALCCRLEQVQVLLDAGADAQAKGSVSMQSDCACVTDSAMASCVYGTEWGNDVEHSGSALFVAVMRDEVSLVEALIAGGADVNAEGQSTGRTMDIRGTSMLAAERLSHRRILALLWNDDSLVQSLSQ